MVTYFCCSGAIWDKFLLYLVQIYHHNEIYAKNAPSSVAVLDEFSEQPQQQIIKKVLYLMPYKHIFGNYKVQV